MVQKLSCTRRKMMGMPLLVNILNNRRVSPSSLADL